MHVEGLWLFLLLGITMSRLLENASYESIFAKNRPEGSPRQPPSQSFVQTEFKSPPPMLIRGRTLKIFNVI